MRSDTPLSPAPGGENAAAASSLSRMSWRSSDDSSTWLDIFRKLYDLIQETIPLIRQCFGISSSSSRHLHDTSNQSAVKDHLTQLANLLPTSTFMTFQIIAPLSTNNGQCGSPEKIVTGMLIVVFAAIIAISTFTDSVRIPSTGKILYQVHYGLVTTKGLWNPAFQGASIPGVEGAFYTSSGNNYTLRKIDFVNAVMSLAAFAALSLLTDPVSSCFFKNLSASVMKTVPLLVSVVISFLLTFAPAARNGIGHRVDAPVCEWTSTTQSSFLQRESAISPAQSTVDVP